MRMLGKRSRFIAVRAPATVHRRPTTMAEEQPNLTDTKAKEEGGGEHINLKVKSQVRGQIAR